MDAVVLAGGRGRRIRTVTDGPKCLLPIGGTAVLDHVIGWLCAGGSIDRVWVAAGYQGDRVRQHVADRYPAGQVRVEVEPEPVGTGGALARLRGRPNDPVSDPLRDPVSDPLVVANGDTMLVGDLEGLLRCHRASSAWVTTAVIPRGRRDADGMAVPILPGPVRRMGRGLSGPGTVVSAGLSVMGGAALDRATCPGSLEGLLASLVAECRGWVWAYPWHAAVDVGTPARYRAAVVQHGG